MKKFISIITFMLLSVCLTANAQTIDHGGPYRMWTCPTVFSVDQEVTFYFDMTDTGFSEGVDLYLWCWNPSEPDAGNWEHSSDFAKLKYLGDNVYAMTMVPTKYFSSGAATQSEEDIYNFCQTDDWPGFWARLKTYDGGEESDVFQAPDSRAVFKEFIASGKDYQFYSAQFQDKTLNLTDKFTLKQPLTLLVNPDKMTVSGVTMNEFKQRAGFQSFNIHSGLNNWTYQQTFDVWVPETVKKTTVWPLRNGLYSWSMTSPLDYYSESPTNPGQSTGLNEDVEAVNLNWLMVGMVNGDWGGTCPDQELKAGSEEEYPDPSFSYFPSKLSSLDILTLTRQWNGKLDGELKCIVECGGKSVTTVMDGSRAKRQASVNLLDVLGGADASSAKVKVVNASGMTLVDTEIPLVPQSEIE